MSEKNGTDLTRVDLENLILVWTKMAELIQLITGDVKVNTDGNLQEQIDAIKENGITAEKLSAARTILVNLASTASASFDGSANATPGVTGILPIANGGTGATTAAEILTKLGITASAAELNYTDGVTANIQTQFNNIVNGTTKVGTANTLANVTCFSKNETVQGWALNTNVIEVKFAVSGAIPADSAIEDREGFYILLAQGSYARKRVLFIPYTMELGIYGAYSFNGSWYGWKKISSGKADTLNGYADTAFLKKVESVPIKISSTAPTDTTALWAY